MSDDNALNNIRRTTLDQIDRQDKVAFRTLVAAGVVEGTGLVLYLVLMDFSNRLHWLIFIAACMVYGTLALGLFALGSEVKASVQRILRAIEEVSYGLKVAEEPGSSGHPSADSAP